jgi:hypothetical protein
VTNLDGRVADATGLSQAEPKEGLGPPGFDPSRGEFLSLIDRDLRQHRVFVWAANAFGEGHARSIPQRGIRLAEEAIEAAQAAGCERAMLHKLVDYIFDRPVGNLGQEIGGVGLTLLALAEAADESADAREASELERVLAKPLAHFAERNRVKNDAGFDLTPCDSGSDRDDEDPKGLSAQASQSGAESASPAPDSLTQKDPQS